MRRSLALLRSAREDGGELAAERVAFHQAQLDRALEAWQALRRRVGRSG